MKTIQLDLGNKKQVRDFLALPARLYADIPQWVPPLEMDDRLRLDPKRYPFYQHSQAAFFLAYEGTRPVGRIAALDHRLYNEYNQKKTAFFYLFECEDDLAASQALFEAAFDWARARGLEDMLGPKGFTVLDGFGLLIQGFEHRPAFGLPYNPPITRRWSKPPDSSPNATPSPATWTKTSSSCRASTNWPSASPNGAACASRATAPGATCANWYPN